MCKDFKKEIEKGKKNVDGLQNKLELERIFFEKNAKSAEEEDLKKEYEIKGLTSQIYQITMNL